MAEFEVPGNGAETFERLPIRRRRHCLDRAFRSSTWCALAADAGIATATVYTYQDSKEQLVAEIVWRTASSSEGLDAVESIESIATPDRTATGWERDAEAHGTFTTPTKSSAAGAAAEPGDSPGIARLRDRITDEINRRVRAALGPDADPAAVRILEDLYAGALIDAEVGYASHASGAEDAGSLVLRILRR
ncbi:hypothetical protein LTT66_31150 [Nocardia gipuzkoensis]|uniref:hypothetical protein n=1 Tax=Nocardia gipuzkoensis TaxID=2749991 RepID=UPI001E453349|nr:hypothetical protein [Nocardia gipuzkoensis]UGT67619.1 hypothetical protein LTT66_31150 [Nocardia gipuzkoensis]